MIFKMSSNASILIIIIIILRKLLGDKIPKMVFSLLWIVAWIRLSIPYPWRSKWSIMNLINSFNVTEKSQLITSGIRDYNESIINNVQYSNILETFNFLKILWLIGIMLTSIYFIGRHFIALKLYREALPLKSQFFNKWKEKHYLYRTYNIKSSDQISSPLTYGFIRPIILIPKTILNNNMLDIEYILLHEWLHIKRWDTLKKLVLVVTLCFHWFNPLVWGMFILINQDIELCCDEGVLKIIGENKKKAYASLLINMEEERISMNPLCSGFRNNYMEVRILSLMKSKNPSMIMIILSVVLVLGITTVFATGSLEDTSDELSTSSNEINIYKMEDITTSAKLIPRLRGKTYEEASSILQELGLSFKLKTASANFTPNLRGKTYEEASSILQELGLSFTDEK